MKHYTFCPYCNKEFTIHDGAEIKIEGNKTYYLSCDCGATSRSIIHRTVMSWTKTTHDKTKIW